MYLLRWFLYVYSTSLIILVSFLFIKRKEIDISRKIKGAFIPISNTILVLFLIVDLIICVFKRRERKTEIINEVYLDDKSFQKFTQEFETINSSINSWRTLLLAMENNTPEYREKLKYFHFQINFIALNIHRKNDPGWFSDIPFETPSEETIDKASAYSRSTKIPGVPDILGMTNVTEYRANKETGIQRFSDSNVDLYIVSVAECLKHHGNIQGAESISTACFEAIEHYASLPVVRYFGFLPALEDVRITRKMILVEAFICLYRVVESLLLELYDEISEGEIITDSIIIKKVKTLL